MLDKNNKDDFDGDFIHAHPSEYLLEETMGRQFLLQHAYMKKIGWFETYAHLCYQHRYKNQII